MRVAYIVTDPGVPVFGRKGCSVHVQELLRALLAAGIEVTLFARRLEGDRPPALDSVSIHPLPPLPRGDGCARERAALASNVALRAALEDDGRFDLVYERYSLWSFAAMDHARSAGIPGLLEVNAPLVDEQAQYRLLEDREGAISVSQRAFRSASGLIAVSRGIAEYLEGFTSSADRIHVVPNGVDPDRFPEIQTPEEPREPGRFTVGFVGSLRPWHGLTVLVEAFARLHRTDPGCRLIVVGDGPERPKLVGDLAAHGLSEAAHLVGSVAPSRVPALLASMDAAVAPYPDLPGFYFSPLKVYEYMAAGLPVVASRIGQLEELITSEVNGLLCRPGCAATLAAALDRLRRDPELRGRLGQGARTTVRQRHTWSAVVSRLLKIAGLGQPARAAGALS